MFNKKYVADDTKRKSVLWSDESNCFWKSWMFCPLGYRRKGLFRLLWAHKFKIQHLWLYEGVLVPMAWVICTCVKAPLLVWRFILSLKQHKLPSIQHPFLWTPPLPTLARWCKATFWIFPIWLKVLLSYYLLHISARFLMTTSARWLVMVFPVYH